MPRCRAIALIGIASARYNRRISAQSSTLITLQSDYKGVTIRPSPGGHRSRVVNTFQGTHGIRRIHRFLTATQQATLRQAAAEIGISSANVHALLNVLERRTGVHLLERNGKRRTMTLTPAGQAFAANVREVLELLSHPPHVEPRGSEPIQWLRGGPRRDRQPKDPSPKSQPNAQLPQHSTQESVLK
ncbi:LysR family transcriptional regulator [Streptosporangium sp. NBC_01469]|uniref:LysR family transcriptional regulator n=1 Tax=Streptosporangium sp. NBC_01469 TaxID=2903898 RepID=UPI003FCD6A8A